MIFTKRHYYFKWKINAFLIEQIKVFKYLPSPLLPGYIEPINFLFLLRRHSIKSSDMPGAVGVFKFLLLLYCIILFTAKSSIAWFSVLCFLQLISPGNNCVEPRLAISGGMGELLWGGMIAVGVAWLHWLASQVLPMSSFSFGQCALFHQLIGANSGTADRERTVNHCFLATVVPNSCGCAGVALETWKEE